MVRGKFYSGQDDLTEVLDIRTQVFVEEMGIAEAIENDGQDAFCMHAVAYEDALPVATGRISYDGWDFVISKVAVCPDQRGKKYGDFIVRMLIDKAMMANADKVQAEVFEDAEPFFETIGFVKTEDREYLAGHKMIQMVLHTDAIHKCCNCR